MATENSSQFESGVVDDLLDDFDHALREQRAPRISDFLARVDEDNRLPLLRDLVLIEMEWHWRHDDSAVRRELQDYATEFPELRDDERCWRDLIADEFRIRHVWGDRPTPEAYAQLYPGVSSLTDRLARIVASEHRDESTDEFHPELRLGRYVLQCHLGTGGFGAVWIAHDSELNRDVAIKRPLSGTGADPEVVAACLREARTLASLSHPNIVPVYDAGRTDCGSVFIVTQLISGANLEDHTVTGGWTGVAEIVASLADALDHAHLRGISHRDVKPSNVLLDESGRVFLTDFGLAAREDDRYRTARFAGTPAYMSPEQARGEAHRVDGRSDIFGLGVVMYELLAGRRPFRGETSREVLRAVKYDEPRPPRQVQSGIPRELERICLKMLSKPVAQRHATAGDVAAEIRAWLHSTTETTSHTTSTELQAAGASTQVTSVAGVDVIPRGLRAFAEDDSAFFTDLLPGPRGRNGLPDTLEFWKSRIESRDPREAFPVGVLYGPSGCGKSSLVRAGLVPQLSSTVLPIYVAARSRNVARDILSLLHEAFPATREASELEDAVQLIRTTTGANHKVLFVIDQFEQVLHQDPAQRDNQLVDALRHCDGVKAQALLLVRDDFWLSLCRFMNSVEVDLTPGHNVALVDLFDKAHAQRVLIRFGQAFERLPLTADLSASQQAFLDRAIDELAEDDRVVCVRLALFAEMTKSREWVPETLDRLGGLKGLGTTFLEEAFFTARALPHHRQNSAAAFRVLRALLPDGRQNIRGTALTQADLLPRSGLHKSPEKLDTLLGILDHELRLVTPGDSENAEAHSRTWQLTHDYLVPSIRDWVRNRNRASARGRAEEVLEDRCAIWTSEEVHRFLPTGAEWLRIRILTDRSQWTEPQTRMMQTKQRRLLLQVLAVIGVVLLGGLGWREWRGHQRANLLTEKLAVAKPAEVLSIRRELAELSGWARPILTRALEHQTNESARVNLSIGLLAFDESPVADLRDRMLHGSPEEFDLICQALSEHRADVVPYLWRKAATEEDELIRLSAAEALAHFAPGAQEWEDIAAPIVDLILADLLARPGRYPRLRDAFQPVGESLIPPLLPYFREHDNPRRSALAASLLADLTPDDLPRLTELLLDASRDQYGSLLARIPQDDARAIDLLEAAARVAIPRRDSQQRKEELASQIANAAIALMHHGKPDPALERLQFSTDPRVRTLLLLRMARYGIGPGRILDLAERQSRSDVTAALIMSLILGSAEQVAEVDVDRILELYRSAFDAEVRSAAECLLRRLGQDEAIAAARAEPTTAGNRNWFVNSAGMTLSIVRAPGRIIVGGRNDDPDRVSQNEQMKFADLDYDYAIATTEATAKQVDMFFREVHGREYRFMKEMTTGPERPAISITYYTALRFCNWLSEREGLEPYYTGNAQGRMDDTATLNGPPANSEGYRLPFDAEWEFACRAGSLTPRYYGYDPALLKHFAWFRENAGDQTHSVGQLLPNRFGLFDMLGNNQEWVHKPGHLRTAMKSTVWARVRGGSLRDAAVTLRSSNRNQNQLSARGSLFGFRVARTLISPPGSDAPSRE